MNNSFGAFFALLRAGLWEREVRLSQYDSIDYAEVYRLAEEQSVVGLIAAGLEHVTDVEVPKVYVLQFVGHALQLEQRNMAMNVFIDVLIEKLRKDGVYALVVKGQGIAQCYERPQWRACGDVDLLLSPDNYSKAKAVLTPLASTVETEYAVEKHLGMTINGFVVELHGTLRSGLSRRIEKGLNEIFNTLFYKGKVRSWINGKTQVFLPGPDEDAIYVFTHILQHFYKGGIGLRQVCDWCRLLWSNHARLDLNLLESRLRQMGLLTAWKTFSVFAVEYLGMPVEAMPFYSSSRRKKRKAKRICSFMMEVGNFGHNRDRSYFGKYPYLIRKVYSFCRRCGDLLRHARIFPIDSLRFFPSIVYNGLRSAARGE